MVCLISTKFEPDTVMYGNSVKEEETKMNVEQNDSDLQLKRVAGGSVVELPPVFSSDGQIIYTVCQKIVQSYSTITGEVIRELEYTQEPFVALQLDLKNTRLLVGCTQSGNIVKWKAKNGVIDSQCKLDLMEGVTVKEFKLIASHDDIPSAIVVVGNVAKQSQTVSIFELNSGKRLQEVDNIELTLKDKVYLDVETTHHNYYAVVQKSSLFASSYRAKEYKLQKHWRSPNMRMLTCIRCHPTEELVATGDVSGRIFLWRQIFSLSAQPQATLYHWHHTPCTSIAFSETGSGFYSSGEEAVLVKWSIDRPDLKEFLPRISSAIRHITVGPGNLKVAIAVADNGIQILDGQYKLNCVVQNFTYVQEKATIGIEKFPVGLKIDPRTNSLVLNGRTGHLQFFSTHTKNLLYNVDIVQQNKLSKESTKLLYDTMVTKVALNAGWMSTGEVWDDVEHRPEVRLKFWLYDVENQRYVLNTNIESPHEYGFNAIEFSHKSETKNLLCATAGKDNVIKVWGLEDSTSIYKKVKIWFCVAEINYKNLPLRSIAFSNDGSILAAGFGKSLCIYQSETLELKAVLSAPACLDGGVKSVNITLPEEPLNGSKSFTNQNSQKEAYELRKNTFKVFTEFLENNDQEIVKRLQAKKPPVSKKEDKIRQKGTTLNKEQQEMLFKRIQPMTQLNLFHKINLYQKLGLKCHVVGKESQHKMRKYIEVNKFDKGFELEYGVRRLNATDRFKGKYKLERYRAGKARYSNFGRELVSFMKYLNLNESQNDSRNLLTNGNVVNGCVSDKDEEFKEQQHNGTQTSSIVIPSVQAAPLISHVLFGTAECSHLVIVCTEHRVLIWNLLTLRLLSVLKLSVQSISVDEITSLIAVLTIYGELYVFSPHAPMAIYQRSNLPKMYNCLWIPRRVPKSYSISVDWQTASTLYFLTETQELMCLLSKSDFDSLKSNATTFTNDAPDDMGLSIFGAYTKRQSGVQFNHQSFEAQAIGVTGKQYTKSLIESATHAMAPVSLLCKDFLKSLLVVEDETTTFSRRNKMKSSDEPSSDNESDDGSIANRRKRLASKELNVKNEETREKSLQIENKLKKIACEKLNF